MVSEGTEKKELPHLKVKIPEPGATSEMPLYDRIPHDSKKEDFYKVIRHT